MREKLAKTNQSVEKVFDIIEVMARAGISMRLQDISEQANIPASTALRLLNTLATYGYANQDTDTMKYSLSLKFALIGSVVASHNNIRNTIHAHLRQLSITSGESCCLAIEEQMEVVYIDTVDGPDNMLTITQRIGKRAPMHSTGVGKAILSDFSEDKLNQFLKIKGLKKLTDKTIISPVMLVEELNILRQRRYCLDDQECEVGARCLAVPIRDYSGKVIAAISISGPIVRMTHDKIDRLIPEILETIDMIEKKLGYKQSIRL